MGAHHATQASEQHPEGHAAHVSSAVAAAAIAAIQQQTADAHSSLSMIAGGRVSAPAPAAADAHSLILYQHMAQSSQQLAPDGPSAAAALTDASMLRRVFRLMDKNHDRRVNRREMLIALRTQAREPRSYLSACLQPHAQWQHSPCTGLPLL